MNSVKMRINQYDIVVVNLDSTIGSEIKKTRPCIVISPNEMNEVLKTIIIAPLTSQPKKYPTRVLIKRKAKNSMHALDQLRTIDKRRIIKIEDQITKKETADIKRTIKKNASGLNLL